MIASRPARAFTLIELLVVIAILGILMGLLFPAVSRALYTANKARAKNDATQIVVAIKGYESEYGRLPNIEDDNANTAELMNILSGQNEAENPRQIAFLEIPRSKNGKNGVESGGGGVASSPWKDPFGEPYEVRMDRNYEGFVVGPDQEEIRTKVIAWSQADSKRTNEDPSKFAKSWE